MHNTEQSKGGPRTEAGKINSSKNSFKHGMCSSQIVIPGEDAEAFESLIDQLEIDHKPANVTELILVHNLAKFQWLMNRAIRLQERAFLNPEKIDTHYLALMIRYQNTNHRSFTNTLKSLHATQKERLRQEREFDSQEEIQVVFSGDDGYDEPCNSTNPYEGKLTRICDGNEQQPRIFERPPGKLA